jgi:hypothetical protein
MLKHNEIRECLQGFPAVDIKNYPVIKEHLEEVQIIKEAVA